VIAIRVRADCVFDNGVGTIEPLDMFNEAVSRIVRASVNDDHLVLPVGAVPGQDGVARFRSIPNRKKFDLEILDGILPAAPVPAIFVDVVANVNIST
jgi:hypothetical protein